MQKNVVYYFPIKMILEENAVKMFMQNANTCSRDAAASPFSNAKLFLNRVSSAAILAAFIFMPIICLISIIIRICLIIKMQVYLNSAKRQPIYV